MTEESMSLESLPVDILLEIGDYLRPRDLLAVSGVCRYLRSALNVSSLWRKYTDGGRISQGLDNTLSLVEPKFKLPCGTSLEPLCEHRYHFLKQSRLLSNLRSGKFVKHSRKSDDKLSSFYLVTEKSPAITYNSKFLFTTGRGDGYKLIKIYDIKINPNLVLTVKAEKHSGNASYIYWLHVFEDKLIVKNGSWFDIYVIRLPQSLDILHSIKEVHHITHRVFNVFIIGKFMLKESLDVVHVWDLSSGNQCNDVRPKTQGPNFNIIGFSQNEQFVILSIGMSLAEPSNPHVFVYNVELQEFSSFNPVLNNRDLKCKVCIGLMDSDYVVLLNTKVSVFVYDYRESTLVVKKSCLGTGRIQDAKIVHGCLVLPLVASVLVMDLKSLQPLWELHPNSRPTFGFGYNKVMEVLHVSSLMSIIVIYTTSGVEMWDFHKRRRILDVEGKKVFINDTCSKFICNEYGKLVILSFW